VVLHPPQDVIVFQVRFVLESGWIRTLRFHDMPSAVGSDRYRGDRKTVLLTSFNVPTGAD
jgi:hypothetical protein